jgi:hypothetical protein
MEPLTIVAISAAVGGAVGAATTTLTGKACELGQKWLSTYFKDHYPKAIEKAEQNSLQFLADLAHRVNQLEETAKDDERIQGRIIGAMEDPDFSMILKDSLLISARTERQETHKILARLVSERLRYESGDLLALTIPLACEAVKNLTAKQLRFLATAAILEYVLLKEVFRTASEEKAQFALDWLKQNIEPVLPEAEIYRVDLLHLVGVACANLTKTLMTDFDICAVLYKRLRTTSTEGFSQFFVEDDVGKRIQAVWEGKISHIRLTSIGLLVGTCVYDELTGAKTDIQDIQHF